MPTHDRREFVPRAIDAFLAQDVTDIELLILDDGADPVRDCVPEDARIRYVRQESRSSLGAKRNALCRLSSSEYIVHWDDDDWYPPHRVRRQVQALTGAGADACGSSTLYYRDLLAGGAFQYRYQGSGRYVTGTTLAYRKSLWQRTPFLELQVGEDTRFVQAIRPDRVLDLADPGLCVATIHGRNVSPKSTSSAAWTRIDPAILSALMAKPAEGSPLDASDARPRASCIMPTADRREFVRIALELFAEQSYPNRELLVVDDGRDPVEDLCAPAAQVRYFRVPRTSIGARRNFACERATGEIVVHWDDDDWYAPDRLARQLDPILDGTADVTGLENTYTLELRDQCFWTSSSELRARMFMGSVHGGTLAFRRRYFAEGARYPDVNLAEDAALLRRMLRRGARLRAVQNDGSFVYIRHARNAWSFETGTFLDPGGWRRVERPALMPESLVQRYRSVLEQSGSATATRAAAPVARADCLQSTSLLGPLPALTTRRCVALVASASCAALLDAALASLARNGGVPDATRVVFIVGAAPACERVAERHAATIVRTQALRVPGPPCKAALYSMADVVEAEQYLCLDADVLVLDSVAPLFERHAALGPGRMLIGPESSRVGASGLGDALQSIYLADARERAVLTAADRDLATYPHVINDGVFVADRRVLSEIDMLLRRDPKLAAWVYARRDVWWRQKAALNLALARLDAAVPMDPSYNVQLHCDLIEPGPEARGPIALWRGQPAKILHFNGAGRGKHAEWSQRARVDSSRCGR